MTNKIVTIGIIGSRQRNSQNDYLLMVDKFEEVVTKISEKCPNMTFRIVSGGASAGGVRFAEEIAKGLGLSITIHYPAKHTIEKGLSRKDSLRKYAETCFTRNTLIAQDSDYLIAMLDEKSNGTKDTIKKYETLKNKKAIII